MGILVTISKNCASRDYMRFIREIHNTRPGRWTYYQFVAFQLQIRPSFLCFVILQLDPGFFSASWCSIQFICSVVSNSLWPHGLQHASFPVHHQLLELTQTHVHQVNNAIQPFLPLSSHSPLAFNLSQNQGLFKWVSSSHQVAKVLEFQLQHQSFQWVFRMDWLDLLAVQGTLKSLLQHHSSKASILWCLAFFTLTSIHDYWKNHSFD